MDDFLPPSPDPGEFTVVSQPIPATMTQDAWFAKYLLGGFTNGCFPPRAQWESISITGHPAGLHGGMAQCNFTEAITIVDGRAYIFTASPNKTNLTGAIYDRALFDALLASVTFDAAHANDAPASPPVASPAPS